MLTSFREMLEGLLGELDYRDTEGVELAYHLYQKACRGNFDIEEILAEHCRKKDVEVKTECSRLDFSMEEEMDKDKQFEEEQKIKKEKIQKKRGKNRILQFFLKKQPEEIERENDDTETMSSHKEMYEGFFEEKLPEHRDTQVLYAEETGTTILGDVPAGRWKLRPIQTGYEEFCIMGDNFVVGKKRGAVDGYIGRETISRIHSRLWVRDNRLFLLDSNSTNGVCVNGRSIEPGTEVEIFAGDRILFADVEYECYNSL